MSSEIKTIKFIDLFAGIGGFRYAMHQSAESLGVDVKYVFASEFDDSWIEVL